MVYMRKKLTANIRFEFTGSSKKQKFLFIVQLAIAIAFVVLMIVLLITYGFSWMNFGLLIIFLYCGYLLIRNAHRTFGSGKTPESGIPELDLTPAAPENDDAGDS